MAKRIVNKAERNAERYDAKETGYKLYEDSQNGKTFQKLMPIIISEQNIILAYRNICKNGGSKTPGTDGKTSRNTRITHQNGHKNHQKQIELTIVDMVCEHIKPCNGERNDTYRNLILLSKEVSELVGAGNSKKVQTVLQNISLTNEMQEKINKLRQHRELEPIQFEDYIGTKK